MNRHPLMHGRGRHIIWEILAGVISLGGFLFVLWMVCEAIIRGAVE
jgi:hypothetical protein